MKRWIIIALLAASPAALAQAPAGPTASEAETRAATEIVRCMVAGLPEDWRIAVMEVNLDKPFDDTGAVRYHMGRGDATTASEPFQPCDVKQPAVTLIEARKLQPEARRGWIGARVTVFRDGRFGIYYGYPK